MQDILKKDSNFKIKDQILRFVKDQDYSENFGFQWNLFRETQIDNINSKISKDRLENQTNWYKEEFKSESNILEAGSGAGRFTKAFLENYNGILHSVDLSNAVESNKKNNLNFLNQKRLYLYQSDIASLPFKDEVFDFIFCFGVLQHTPNPKKTLTELISKAKKGAKIVIDFYPMKGFWTILSIKYFLRPITKRMNSKILLNLIKLTSPFFYFVYKLLEMIGLSFLVRFLPICDPRTIPATLNKKETLEWIILDTFDMFSAYYDYPQKISDIEKIFISNNCNITFSGYINYKHGTSAVVRATKK